MPRRNRLFLLSCAVARISRSSSHGDREAYCWRAFLVDRSSCRSGHLNDGTISDNRAIMDIDLSELMPRLELRAQKARLRGQFHHSRTNDTRLYRILSGRCLCTTKVQASYFLEE